MSNEKEDKLKINNIGLGERVLDIANQFRERIYHYDKRKENKIAVGTTPPPADKAEWQDLWIDTSESLDMWNVQFVQTEHQTIICTDFFGNRHSEDFQLKDGTPYTVTVEADPGYIPGKPNIEQGIIHSDIILFATSNAVPELYWIHIIQSEHQLITVLADGERITSDKEFITGTQWMATISPDNGYTAGQLNISGGTLTGDITVEATPAQINYYWIHITKYDHQRIMVVVDGVQYFDDFQFPYGTRWEASVIVDNGYTAGVLNMRSGVLTNDITINATPATILFYWIRIEQYDHQRIIVSANNIDYTKDIQLPYGTVWTAKVEADEGYTAGTISNSGGTLTEDIYLTASQSSINTYTLTITQSPNQTITVTTDDGRRYTSTVTLPYGTKWTATVTASQHYIAGTINKDNGTITANDEVHATAATPMSYTIHITKYEHQTITVTVNGERYTEDCTFVYGTQWSATVTAQSGYDPGTLNLTGGILDADVTLTASDAIQNTFHVTIINPSHETITVIEQDTGIRHTGDFDISKRSPITIQVVADNGYLAGKPTIDGTVFDDTVYYVVSDIVVSAETATVDNRIHFFIEDRPDQIITVTYNNTIYINGEDFFANPDEVFYTEVKATILGFTAGDCEFAPSYTVPKAPSTIYITAEAPYTKEFVDIYFDDPMPDLYEDYRVPIYGPGEYSSRARYYTKADGNPITVRRGSTLMLGSAEAVLKDARKTVDNNYSLFTINGSYVACEDTHLQFRNPVLVRDGTCELSRYSLYDYPSHSSYNVRIMTYSIIKNYLLEGDTSGVRSQRSFAGAEAFDIDKLDGAYIEAHSIAYPYITEGRSEEDKVFYTKRLTSGDNLLYSSYNAGMSDEYSVSAGGGSDRITFKTVTIRVQNDDPNQWIGLSSTGFINDDWASSYEEYKSKFTESIEAEMYETIICVVFPNEGYRAGDPQGKYVHGHTIYCIEDQVITATPATPLNGSTDDNYFGAIKMGAVAHTDKFTVYGVQPLDTSMDVQFVDYKDSTHTSYKYLYDTTNSLEFDIDNYRLYANPDTGTANSGRINFDLSRSEKKFTKACDIYVKQSVWPETGTTRAKTSNVKFRSDPDGGTGFVLFCKDSGYCAGSQQGLYIQQMFFTSEASGENSRTYQLKVGSEYTAITYPKQNVITCGTCDQPSGTIPENGLTLTCTGSVVNQYNTLFYGDVYDTLGDKVIVQYKLPGTSDWVDVDRAQKKIDLPIRTSYRIHKNTSEVINSYIHYNYLHYYKYDAEQVIGPKIQDSSGFNDSYSNLGNVMLHCEKYNVEHKLIINLYDSKNPEFRLSGSASNGASGRSNSFTKQTITASSQDTRSNSYDLCNDNPYVYYRLSTSNSVNKNRYALNCTSSIYIQPMKANCETTLYVYDTYTNTIVDSENSNTPDFTILADCTTDPSNYYGYSAGALLHGDMGECSIDNPRYVDIYNNQEVQYPIKAVLFDIKNREILVELDKTGTLTDLSAYNPNLTIRVYNYSTYYMTGRLMGDENMGTFYFVASSVEERSNKYIIHYSDQQADYFVAALERLRSSSTSESYWKFDIKFTRSSQQYRSLTFGTYEDNNYRYAGYWTADALKAPIKETRGSLTSDIIHGKSTNTDVEFKVKAFIFCQGKNGKSDKTIIEVQNLTDPSLRYVDTSIGIRSYVLTELMSLFIYKFISADVINNLVKNFDTDNGTTYYMQFTGETTSYSDFERNFVSGQNQVAELSGGNFMTSTMVNAMFYTSNIRYHNFDILRSAYIVL